MKKFITLLMASLLILSTFAACGSSEKVTSKVIDIELTSEEYAFGVDKTQPELLDKVNAFIEQIMDDGTFADICNHYFGDGTPVAVTSAKQDSSKDQLIVATNAEFAPFEYMEGDSYYGIDMEIASALASYLGKELVILNMDFNAVCLSVSQQKCDIAMAGLTVTDDRKEQVTFTTSYYNAAQKLVVKSTCTEFDECKTAADVEAILNAKNKNTKIGVQDSTTSQSYCEGSEDFGFAGLPVTCVSYQNSALAVQDLLNGNLDYVIIDAAPAARITEAINAMQ